MINAEEVLNEVSRMAQIIGAHHRQFPTVCQLQGGGRPNITITEDGEFTYEAYERGLQIFSYSFTDLDGAMYHTFKEISSVMASDYASEIDPEYKDEYQAHFSSKQIELMSKIKAEWGPRIEEEQKIPPY